LFFYIHFIYPYYDFRKKINNILIFKDLYAEIKKTKLWGRITGSNSFPRSAHTHQFKKYGLQIKKCQTGSLAVFLNPFKIPALPNFQFGTPLVDAYALCVGMSSESIIEN